MLADKLIIRLSLVVIILGLVGLYLTSIFVEPEFVGLSEISTKNVGDVVKTRGIISSYSFSEKSKTLFLDLEENGKKLSVVLFNFDENPFERGDEVSVKGEVSVYEGKLEIIARDIEKIK